MAPLVQVDMFIDMFRTVPFADFLPGGLEMAQIRLDVLDSSWTPRGMTLDDQNWGRPLSLLNVEQPTKIAYMHGAIC